MDQVDGLTQEALSRIRRLEESREEISDLRSEQKSLGDAHSALYRRIYGNGQPGDMKVMADKVDQLRAFMWKIVGGAAVAGTLLQHFWK
jgi:hypothetical protein